MPKPVLKMIPLKETDTLTVRIYREYSFKVGEVFDLGEDTEIDKNSLEEGVKDVFMSRFDEDVQEALREKGTLDGLVHFDIKKD